MSAALRIIFFSLLCFTPLAARAADGDFVWARAIGGIARDIALDGGGNVYTAGYFEGTLDFDPGPGVLNLTSGGGKDFFIQKLDTNGNLLWARAMGGTGDDRANGIAVDGAGNVYTTGYFRDTVDFNPGARTFNLTSAGLTDIFVQKLDTNGNYVWAYGFGAAVNDEGSGIAADSAGNVYVIGNFQGSVDFDPGAGSHTLISNGPDSFVLKLVTNGSLTWAQSSGPWLDLSIALDSADNVYWASRGDDILVQKLAANGGPIWTINAAYGHDGRPNGIAVDSSGNVLITGTIVTDLVEQGGDVLWTYQKQLIQKNSPNQDLLWTRFWGPSASYTPTLIQDIALDDMGNVYTTGTFHDTQDFDPGEGTVNLTSPGHASFVQKLDDSGNFVLARHMGGASYGVAVDSAGNIYTTGDFYGTDDFDPGAGIFELTSANESVSGFVLKLGPSGPPASVVSITPSSTGPTNADSMVFTVTFDEAVQEFNAASDLVIVHDGTTHTGTTISGGPTVYSVAVTGISGDGSFNLAVNANSDVRDLAGNGVASSEASPAVLIDNTPPSSVIGTPSNAPVNSTGLVTYPVMIEGASSINLTSSRVILNHNGTAGGSVTIIDGADASPTVQVSGVTGDGNYTISLLAGIATDVAGNPSEAAGPSEPVTVDNTLPAVGIGAPTGSPVNSSGMASFPVTIDGASGINFSSSHVTLNHSGTAGGSAVVIDGASLNPTVQVSGVTGDGNYTISIAAEVATDALGNKSLAAGPSSPVAVDNTPPAVSIGMPSLATVNSTGTASYPITISGGNIHNLASDDVTLNHSGTAGGSVDVVDGDSASPAVQVSGVTGDGSYTVSIAGGIAADALGNASLAAGPGSAVTVDNAPPTVSIGAPTGGVVNSSRTATYPVTVSGAKIVNLTSGDVSIQHQGTSGGTVNIVTGRSSTPLVQVSGVTGNGRYTISIAKGIATDAASNESLATGPSADAVTVDNTAPTVSIGAPLGTPVNRSGTVSFPVTVSGASVVNLTRGEVSLSRNGASGGSVNILNGASTNPTVQVSGLTGNGTFTISIADGIATDAAANDSTLAGPSVAATVDNASPIFSRIVVSPAEASEGDMVNIGFESSEPIVGDPEVTVNDNPASRTAKAGLAYEYTVSSTDPLGPATIEVGGLDSSGNAGTSRNTTALTITETVAEGEGDVAGEGESEGEGENPSAVCGGCNPTGAPMEKSLGDWLAAFLGLAVLLGAHLSLRSRLVG